MDFCTRPGPSPGPATWSSDYKKPKVQNSPPLTSPSDIILPRTQTVWLPLLSRPVNVFPCLSLEVIRFYRFSESSSMSNEKDSESRFPHGIFRELTASRTRFSRVDSPLVCRALYVQACIRCRCNLISRSALSLPSRIVVCPRSPPLSPFLWRNRRRRRLQSLIRTFLAVRRPLMRPSAVGSCQELRCLDGRSGTSSFFCLNESKLPKTPNSGVGSSGPPSYRLKAHNPQFPFLL